MDARHTCPRAAEKPLPNLQNAHFQEGDPLLLHSKCALCTHTPPSLNPQNKPHFTHAGKEKVFRVLPGVPNEKPGHILATRARGTSATLLVFEGLLGYKPFLVRTVLSTERRNSHFLFAPMSQVQHSSCIRGAASPASAGQPFSPSREPGFQVLNFIRPLPPFSV